MNSHALTPPMTYGTPLQLPYTEQVALAATIANRMNQRDPANVYTAAPYAWRDGTRIPIRWGIQKNRAAFVLTNWETGRIVRDKGQA